MDVGADISDFRLQSEFNNAKKVIILELYPCSYNQLLKNKKNNMEDKIISLSAGYSQDGIIF